MTCCIHYVYSVYMVKGRTTSVLSVRLPDELAASLKYEARRQKLLLSDYLKSILVNRRGTERELKVKPPEGNDLSPKLVANDSSIPEKHFHASPSPVKKDKARAKRHKAKTRNKRH